LQLSASYAALDLAGPVTAASGRTRLTWLIGRSTAIGIGIWATHYIGCWLSTSLRNPKAVALAAYDKPLSRYSLVFK